VTVEEVQWAMKDYIEEWKVPVVSKKGSKGKKHGNIPLWTGEFPLDYRPLIPRQKNTSGH
jgi:hypothetical protein